MFVRQVSGLSPSVHLPEQRALPWSGQGHLGVAETAAKENVWPAQLRSVSAVGRHTQGSSVAAPLRPEVNPSSTCEASRCPLRLSEI